MEEFIQLVGLYKKSKFRAVDLSALLLGSGSQIERLYKGIAAGLVQSESQILDLFPEFKNSATRAAARFLQILSLATSGLAALPTKSNCTYKTRAA